MGLIRWGRWSQITPIHISTPGGADDPNQATRRIRVGDERGVDAVQRENRAVLCDGELKNLIVGNLLVCPSCLV